MAIFINVFAMIYGDIYEDYVNKGEDCKTASLLTSVQVTLMLLLNVMSFSFLLSSFFGGGGEEIISMSKYQLVISVAVLLGTGAALMYRYFDWESNYKNKYSHMLVSQNFKTVRRIAKITPYATMGLFVVSMVYAM